MGKLGEWEELRASGISAFFPGFAGICFDGLLWHCAEVPPFQCLFYKYVFLKWKNSFG